MTSIKPMLESRDTESMTKSFPAQATRRNFLSYGTLAFLGVTALKPAWTLPQTQTSPRTLRFGLNYVPRKNWWYAWDNWDRVSISEDLEAIRDLGMDHIRIQCLWPTFQPGINYVNTIALSRLLELLDLAEAANLDVQVTVLDGWLSGYSFLPAWVAPLTKDGNIFTSSKVIEAEKLLFQELAAVIGKHKRFLGFDLGNEIEVEQGTAGNDATLEEADRWATTMLTELERLAPGKLHVNGVAHEPWLKNTGFSRSNLATTGSATIIHCYAYWSGALKQYRYNDVGSLHLLEYMVELAKAYQKDPARKVWVEEVGTSAEWMPEEYIPEYARILLANAASCANLWGFTWWCSHDIDPALKGFLSLEYNLGVLDTHNRAKPIGRALARLIDNMRCAPPEPLKRSVAIVLPGTEVSSMSGSGQWAIPDQFMELIRQGRRPALILESRAHDELYLQARGIEDLVRGQG
jgi:endo-1,4-beta-mannosidase